MSKAVAQAASLPATRGDLKVLRGLVDLPALQELGWDQGTETFSPRPDDPVFGLAECKVAGCDQGTATNRWGLCYRCLARWRRSGTELEQFCATPAPPAQNRSGPPLCTVCCTPGHERPQHWLGLCASCTTSMLQRGQSKEEYLNGDGVFPPASPRQSFGKCQVAACQRWAHHREPTVCASHYRRWVKAGRPTAGAFRAWCSQETTLDSDRRRAYLGGLGERARLEVLYGLQCRAMAERRTPPTHVQMVANLFRSQGAASVFDLSVEGIADERRLFVLFVRDHLTLAMARPETEKAKDTWDLRVFGRAGRTLRFGQIRQVWLAKGAKQWAFERLSTVESSGHLERVAKSVGLFSASLCRHRPDKGADPTLLSRADVLAFCNDLAHLEGSGRLSRYHRRAAEREVAQFLREARGMGLTAPGSLMAGLPADVVLQPGHRARARSHDPDDEEPKALPQVVVDQLLDGPALEALEAQHGTDMRAMVELQAEVGRRTGELCQLRWDCLCFGEVLDELGQARPSPVLVHDMPKVGAKGHRLPVGEAVVEVVRAQQERVKKRYPGTPTSLLALFPSVVRNPRGTKSFSANAFAANFRTWVDSLPELLGPGGEPFYRSGITVYSFRHCFAQRHADAGTPVEVLASLMGHRQLSTTQIYYRVTHKRKRKAVDLLAALQVDRNGDRSRPTLERILDSDQLRDAVGQVAVPFGICTEPTNIKAHGQSCPFRHQCFGCSHFRSDPSFLPELRAYLGRLLADRERLRAVAPELADWARKQAVPSAEETSAVRRVIERCEALVGNLGDDERAQVEQATEVLRRGRAQLDTSVPVRFRGSISQATPTLFPNLEGEGRRR
ncbi:MAG: tyrosine-type recombinase/integrase [Actinomycetota bacterium]|jgi:integrase|nr:tyrosine-type recombinase/integrase [Actinomycetota bacterium]